MVVVSTILPHRSVVGMKCRSSFIFRLAPWFLGLLGSLARLTQRSMANRRMSAVTLTLPY